MAIQTECLDENHLRGLLNNTLPTTEYKLAQQHLDECENCQQLLEQMAVGNTSMLQAARDARMDTPPEQGSAYWRALNDLNNQSKPANPTSLMTNEINPPPVGITGGKSPDAIKLDFLEADEDTKYLGRLDRYRIAKLVGRGGMGMVFQAMDQWLERTVAIKVLDPQVARNETARGRFCREARASASVTHPNVVTIYHVERVEERDLSYLVMQYVDGESLQERIDREKGPLPVLAVVRIGKQIAEGLAAAHAKGLIHRDIKPANVLLENSTGRVLLTDFGLARLMEDVKLTQTGYVAGTPLFMSPEQAKGESVDPRSDLFSLGGVLYAMSTGRPPFEGKTPLAVLQQVTQGNFEPVQRANPMIPGVLAGLIDSLLDKNPTKRLQTANEVVEALTEIENRLTRDPSNHSSKVRSSRTLLRFERGKNGWLNRVAMAVLSLNLLLLFTELTGQTHLFTRGASGIVTCVPEPRLAFPGNEGPIWTLAYSPNQDLVAAGLDEGSIKVYLTDKGGKEHRKWMAHLGTVWSLSFSPDGKRLASAGDDGFVKIWNAENFSEQYVMEEQFDPPPKSISYSPDGKKIVVGLRNGAVRLWDLEEDRIPFFATNGHDGAVREVIYSPQGDLIISAGADRQIQISDSIKGILKQTLQGHTGPIYSIAMDPTGQFLVSASWDQTIRIWDVKQGRELDKIEVGSKVLAIRLIHEGKEILASCGDHHVRRYDFTTRKLTMDCQAGEGLLPALSVSIDEKSLLTAGWEGILRVFDLR